MKNLILILTVFAIFAGIAFVAYDLSSQSIQLNNEGVEYLTKENSGLAYKSFVTALENEPFNPFVQMNLGLSFLINKEFDKAQQVFLTVAKLAGQNQEIKFYGLFNAAIAATQAKNIDGALHFYQLALEVRPDSKEVKTNIELLWQGQGNGEGDGQNQKSDPKGKGKGDDKNQSQDQKDQKDQKNQDQNKEYKDSEPHKPKLGTEALSKEQIQAILNEIKNQEQKIRAEENEQGAKEAPNGKDW